MGERESPEGAPVPEEEPVASAPPKKPGFLSVKNIIIALVGMAVSAVVAIFVVGSYIAPSIEQRREEQQAKAEEDTGDVTDLENLQFLRLEPIVVNPADSNGERYLKAVVTLETYSIEVNDELNKRISQIKNQINTVLSSKTIDQIQTSQDRERLRREIQNRVNGMLVSGQVSNVYFEEFVYQ